MNRGAAIGLLLALAALAGCQAEVETVAPTGQTMPAAPRVAQGKLNFVEGFERGYESALSSGKPMLVFFTAEWCHFCHQMADEAFANGEVVKLSDQFACILVDADAEPEVCRKFRVQGFPTVQFLSPRGTPLNRLVGKKPTHELMMAMQAALQNVARHAEPTTKTR